MIGDSGRHMQCSVLCLLINTGILYVTEAVFLLCQRWNIHNSSPFPVFHSIFSILLCFIFIVILSNWPAYTIWCGASMHWIDSRAQNYASDYELKLQSTCFKFCLLYHLPPIWINDFIKYGFYFCLFIPLPALVRTGKRFEKAWSPHYLRLLQNWKFVAFIFYWQTQFNESNKERIIYL